MMTLLPKKPVHWTVAGSIAVAVIAALFQIGLLDLPAGAEEVKRIEKAVVVNAMSIQEVKAAQARLNQGQAVSDTRQRETSRRLNSIDEKLDRITDLLLDRELRR